MGDYREREGMNLRKLVGPQFHSFQKFRISLLLLLFLKVNYLHRKVNNIKSKRKAKSYGMSFGALYLPVIVPQVDERWGLFSQRDACAIELINCFF